MKLRSGNPRWCGPVWAGGVLTALCMAPAMAADAGLQINTNAREGALMSLLLLGVAWRDAQSSGLIPVQEGQPLTLSSPAFAHNGAIPRAYTCDGKNISPPLIWNGVPTGTKSLALIVADPDAPDPANPKMIWTHWIVYNLPVTLKGLPEAASGLPPPVGAVTGLNDWGRADYGGPCPPIGRHRYFHTLYALDRVLPILRHPTREVLEQAIHGHALARAELIGVYQRPR